MSESTESTAEAGEQQQPGQQEAPAAFSQEDVDRIVQDRLQRERKRFDGFDEFKAAAERVPELETANRELAEKVTGFEAAEERARLVSEVAASSGVPAGALRGTTREELEAHAEALKPLISTTGPVIPGQEKTPPPVQDSDEKRAVRNLFGTT